MAKRALLFWALAAAALTASPCALAQGMQCRATNDPVTTAICGSPRMLEREVALIQNFAGALIVADDSQRKTMRDEQATWDHDRLGACKDASSAGIEACIDALTEPRAKKVAAMLPHILDKESDSLLVLDRRLDIGRGEHPGVTGSARLQLRYDGRVLAESLSRFQVVARGGDATAEAVVLRAPSDGSTPLSFGYLSEYGEMLVAVVVTRGSAPEVWPLPASLFQKGSLEIRGGAGLTVAGKLYDGHGPLELRWTPKNGWEEASEPDHGETLMPPFEVTEAHAREPAIQAYCDEPRTPGLSASCARADVESAEASLGQALRDCLATLGPEERAMTIDRHNRGIADDRHVYGRAPAVSDWSILHVDQYRTKDYRECADGELTTWGGGKIRREPKEIVVGTKKLVEAWVPRSVGSSVVLRLGTNTVIEAEPGRIEVDDEWQVGDTSAVIVDTPMAGTDMCHIRYLIADSPGQPLRVWKVPDRSSCLSSGIGEFKIEHVAEGYRFEVTPSPFAEGAVYRWTPEAGMTFEKTLTYQLKPGSLSAEYHEAIRRVEGPNVGMLRDYLALSRRIATPGDAYTVIGECDQPFRSCLYRAISPVRAIFENGGRALYLATYGWELQEAACGSDPASHRPLPGVPKKLLGIPIEYHPAREQWPVTALEVLRTTFCPTTP